MGMFSIHSFGYPGLHIAMHCNCIALHCMVFHGVIFKAFVVEVRWFPRHPEWSGTPSDHVPDCVTPHHTMSANKLTAHVQPVVSETNGQWSEKGS